MNAQPEREIWHRGARHRFSEMCPCASCQDARAVTRRILLALVFFWIGFGLTLEVPPFPLHGSAKAAIDTPPLRAGASGAVDQSRKQTYPRVVPSVAQAQIGAPFFQSTWRWRLREACGSHVTTATSAPPRGRMIATIPRRPGWCARWSNDA